MVNCKKSRLEIISSFSSKEDWWIPPLFSNVPYSATYGFVLLCLFCDIPSCYVLFSDVPLCDVPFCDTPFCDVPFCILTLSYTSFSAFKHLLVLSLPLSFAWSKKPSPSRKWRMLFTPPRSAGFLQQGILPLSLDGIQLLRQAPSSEIPDLFTSPSRLLHCYNRKVCLPVIPGEGAVSFTTVWFFPHKNFAISRG